MFESGCAGSELSLRLTSGPSHPRCLEPHNTMVAYPKMPQRNDLNASFSATSTGGLVVAFGTLHAAFFPFLSNYFFNEKHLDIGGSSRIFLFATHGCRGQRES